MSSGGERGGCAAGGKEGGNKIRIGFTVCVCVWITFEEKGGERK